MGIFAQETFSLYFVNNFHLNVKKYTQIIQIASLYIQTCLLHLHQEYVLDYLYSWNNGTYNHAKCKIN